MSPESGDPAMHATTAPGQRHESPLLLVHLDEALAGGGDPVALFAEALRQGSEILHERFRAHVGAEQLVRGRSWLVDHLLVRAWSRFIRTPDELALVAVGGYGRAELLPASDIDLMILLPDEAPGRYNADIEALLTFAWDIGLEVGHSVRTLEDCSAQAQDDITVVTNLMEARLLAGSRALFQAMRIRIGPDRIWPCREFFAAKWEEQKLRHHKFHDTAYKLEPNVKKSPGGLRDIQMIGWVTKRYFGTDTLAGLLEHEFLTEGEYHSLMKGQNFLWEVRYALHMLTGRGEDRLLFDYQRTLAEQFGYRDRGHHLAVEQFMKQYYRTVMELSRLNEMLLQLFQEAILHASETSKPVPINRRFQSRRGFLEIRSESVFRKNRFALLELFLLLEQHTELKGVRASTIRAIRNHRHLINDSFRADIRGRSLFMEILRQPHGVTHVLRRMNVYGVLAAYMPAFANIVGLMQYDLFHVYTVDEHTLFVLRNIRRFTVTKYAHEFPLCSQIISRIPKLELLYLAALFHDIAKGRGGDHSELGAGEAASFCRKHGLSEYDTGFVSWLVRNHLIMSTTAQRRDISDPLVINEFARTVGTPVRLDYLYLLTVADIRGTNPDLWNGWKDALLKQLYKATRQALRRGLERPLDRREHIEQVQAAARQLLKNTGWSKQDFEEIWNDLGDEYFLRYSPDQIAWHAEVIARHRRGAGAHVHLHQLTLRGGTEIFIYTPSEDYLFARITAALAQLGLNVVDARIITSENGDALDTFLVLEESGEPIEGNVRSEEVIATIEDALSRHGQRPLRVTRRARREIRHFQIETRIDFKTDEPNRRTMVELLTADRPGLLSLIGQAFTDSNVRIQNARIATLGAEVDDVFFVTDLDNRPLEEPRQFERLRETLSRYIDGSERSV
jgi:[protein-PII] uridylyltransferase